VISLLDLGVERPRDAMTFGAPEAEALYEGSAQKGFGVSSLDGSPVPLGSTAINEPIGISISLWGRWKPPMPQRCYSIPVDQEAKQHKQININDNQ
jgi:hypothetical protein